MYPLFSDVSVIVAFFSVIFFQGLTLGFAADNATRQDPQTLESGAKHNYYIGEYYYNQGRYDAAEPYFRRTRDLIEKKNQIVSERRVKPGVDPQETGSAGSLIKQGVKPEDAVLSLEYSIGDGDVLYITVWQNDELNQEVSVRPDGKISFPLIGEMQATGLSLERLRAEITRGLKDYIRAPEVSIVVRRMGGSKVIVLGQVVYPGVYGVSGKKSILEAIALAGGFTNDAVVSSVILVRGGLDKPQAQRLDLNKSLSGKAANVELEPEDIIFVPKKFVSDLNYAVNQILSPLIQGAYTTQGYRSKRW